MTASDEKPSCKPNLNEEYTITFEVWLKQTHNGRQFLDLPQKALKTVKDFQLNK